MGFRIPLFSTGHMVQKKITWSTCITAATGLSLERQPTKMHLCHLKAQSPAAGFAAVMIAKGLMDLWLLLKTSPKIQIISLYLEWPETPSSVSNFHTMLPPTEREMHPARGKGPFKLRRRLVWHRSMISVVKLIGL